MKDILTVSVVSVVFFGKHAVHIVGASGATPAALQCHRITAQECVLYTLPQ